MLIEEAGAAAQGGGLVARGEGGALFHKDRGDLNQKEKVFYCRSQNKNAFFYLKKIDKLMSRKKNLFILYDLLTSKCVNAVYH
jgi:hypothetical protein